MGSIISCSCFNQNVLDNPNKSKIGINLPIKNRKKPTDHYRDFLSGPEVNDDEMVGDYHG